MPGINPKVSIVIPAYNAMPYLEEAIESVLAQDYQNVELIVLDDGSKDDTQNLLAKYQGRFYFESQPNMGQANTLNKGWSLSQGEIISYLSADDRLMPEAVRLAVDEFQRDPSLVFTYSDNQLIDSESRFIRSVANFPRYDYYQLLSRGYTLCGVGCFFLKSTLKQVGGWDSRYRFIADFEHQLRLAKVGKFKHIPQALGCYRVHDQAISHSYAGVQQADELKNLMEEILASTDDSALRASKHKLLSKAYLISGRTHWRSQRYRTGAHYFWHSLRLFPASLLSLETHRIILNALLNKKIHAIIRKIRGRK